MSIYKMVIGYDGRRYKGWRKTKEKDEQTIQGKIEMILEKLFGEAVEAISAVNTDAGVHASCQVAHFLTPDERFDETMLKDYLEEFLPDDIVVYSVEKAGERFHSRYNVESVTYTYRLWKTDAPFRPLFERNLVNVMDRKLNVRGMQIGAKAFVGEHDFTAFATKTKANSSTKTITELEVEETETEVIIRMTANGFLLNMERYIVGTLIQIGLGQREIDSIDKAFRSKNNKDAGHKVMAHALILSGLTFK